VLRAIMDISAHAVSLPDRPRMGHLGHQGSQTSSQPTIEFGDQCFSGYLLMKPSRLGIFTLGNVSPLITSFSPMIVFSARI
jgi:hypothetical protein